MTSQSRQKIGWLSPFISLLTIGLDKPDKVIAVDTEADTTAVLTVLEPARPQKTYNFDKARDFRLSARLSVTAQLNRPKPVETKRRKIYSAPTSQLPWQRAAKFSAAKAEPTIDGAVVIKFPTQANFGKTLSQAA